jgi:cellobiose epimerase
MSRSNSVRRPIQLAILFLAAAAFIARGVPRGEPAASDWPKTFRDVLENNILKFWLTHAYDREYGGMLGWLDRQGNPIAPGTKSLVQQSRVVWTFAAAYRLDPKPEYRDAATYTLKFLRDKMRDDKNGGLYWLVDREGKVLADKKHLYGESFAIYALAEYARAFNDSPSRKEALALFQLIDAQAHDARNGGYHEPFSRTWRPLPSDTTLGPAGLKTMNTHIHLLESLTTLYRATGDPLVRKRVEELLNICLEKIVDSRRGYARLYFTDDWKPAGDTNTSSYGHDIELSWLIEESAEALGRPRGPQVLAVSHALVEHTLRDGTDREHGGVYDSGPADGPAKSQLKVWWVEAETLVGLLNAYQLTSRAEYRALFDQQARYVLANFVDKEYGEWFNTIEPDGRISGDKTDEWKGPYHAGRACMEIIRRLQKTP